MKQSIRKLFERVQRLALLLAAVTVVNPVQADTYYFHNDHLGTPQVLTDKDQQVVWKGEYDPFGKVTETVSQVEQNLRFPGQYYDEETGLHYNYFRTYDPGVGRYVESDPIGLAGGSSTYGYAYQSPVMYTDPTGLLVPAVVVAPAVVEGVINTVAGCTSCTKGIKS